jgi:hypothetical protein
VSITARPYAGDADRDRMRDLIVATSAGARPNYWHVGDLLWGLYQNTVFDPFANIRLWEGGAGELRGFAWFSPPVALEWEVAPRPGRDAALEEQMLAWGEARGRRSSTRPATTRPRSGCMSRSAFRR